jgi:hypothetical protein
LDQEDLAKLLDILGASKRNARAVAVELTPGEKKHGKIPEKPGL